LITSDTTFIAIARYPKADMILVTKWFGTFLCEPDRVLESRLFPNNLDAIASRMRRMRGREILEEESELGNKAKAVAERRLGGIAKVVAFDSTFIRAEKYGFDQELLRQATMQLARESLTEEDPGAYITEQVRAFDDLLMACNLMSERLREWYGLYYPELERLVDDKRYAELVAADPEGGVGVSRWRGRSLERGGGDVVGGPRFHTGAREICLGNDQDPGPHGVLDPEEDG